MSYDELSFVKTVKSHLSGERGGDERQDRKYRKEVLTRGLYSQIIASIPVSFPTQDGMICLAGCDKTIPGVTMALPRLNAVSLDTSSLEGHESVEMTRLKVSQIAFTHGIARHETTYFAILFIQT